MTTHAAIGTEQAAELVLGQMREVLRSPQFTATDDFFESGGDSLLATGVAERLRRITGIDLPIFYVFTLSDGPGAWRRPLGGEPGTMSVAFVFGPNAPLIDFDGTIHFYEGNAAVRRSFDMAAQCTGVSVDVLLRKREIPDGLNTMRINSVALAAASLGTKDALAEVGVIPTVVGGLSLGDMMAPAATGAMSGSDFVSMLCSFTHGPASSAPGHEEAIAFAYLPADEDPSPYYEPQPDGVYFGASLGKVPWGDGEAVMLSGYRSALEEFAAQHPNGNVRVRDRRVCSAAYHSPLRMRPRAKLERMLDDMAIEDPMMPICSSVLDRPVTTAAGVRDLLLRNCVEAAWVSKMIAQVMSYEPRLVVTIGPAMAKGMFVFPVPVCHVDSLETLADAIAEAGRAQPAGGRLSTAIMRSSQV